MPTEVDGVLPKEVTQSPQAGQPPLGIIHSFHKWFSKDLNQEPLLLFNLIGDQLSFNDYLFETRDSVAHTAKAVQGTAGSLAMLERHKSNER